MEPDPSPPNAEQWRAVIAALRDDAVRAVLAETVGLDSISAKRRSRAVARLSELGILHAGDDGDPVFDDSVLTALLSSPPRPAGNERFLDREGRIDRYPANARDRAELLAWVAARAFEPDDVLTEPEVNERLLPYAPGGDVAVLRRYLVDHGLLLRTRSGSSYAPAPAPQ
ncbi:MAG: hypothetical protein DI566_08750 [Microbacterium sp.]|nr:MAG: hypothetical protein DI566_08750 [Microbacterium sp.]